ncbi:hypothetical protein HY494_01125 [Candidatus Woesearchaeota archaeon]|nr:hypothetical protein [Candidatus Woesearchaeota archaeon]
MSADSPLVLPEFKVVFDCEVYSIDFMTTDNLDLSNPDLNALRRSFLVLGRYTKPAVSEISAYLQQTIQQHLSASKQYLFDAQLSPLIANLNDHDLVSLLNGDQEKIMSGSLSMGKQYLDVHYFTVPAPLYIQQGKKTADPDWYHNVFSDAYLHQNGLQQWFIIRMGYTNLLQPKKVVHEIKQSTVQDKEGTIYVLENICRIFSPFPYFTRIRDITPSKIKEAALETLVHLQKENNSNTAYGDYKNEKNKKAFFSSSYFMNNKKGIIDLN